MGCLHPVHKHVYDFRLTAPFFGHFKCYYFQRHFSDGIFLFTVLVGCCTRYCILPCNPAPNLPGVHPVLWLSCLPSTSCPPGLSIRPPTAFPRTASPSGLTPSAGHSSAPLSSISLSPTEHCDQLVTATL